MTACYNEEMWDHQSSAKPESVEFTDAELVALFQMRGQSHKVDMDEASYFVAGSFDSKDRESHLDSRALKNYDPGNYQYDKEIIHGISPR